MKHYFLLFLIITNFPIVSYGFSLLPTRMNIINKQEGTFFTTDLYDDDNEYKKNVSSQFCVTKNDKIEDEKNCTKFGNYKNYGTLTLGYEPFYIFNRFGLLVD